MELLLGIDVGAIVQILDQLRVPHVEVRVGDVGRRPELAGRHVEQAVGQVEVGLGECGRVGVVAPVLGVVGGVAHEGLVQVVAEAGDALDLGLLLVDEADGSVSDQSKKN